MDFKLYQEMSKRTMPKPVEGMNHLHYSKDSVSNYAMGLCGEAGEVTDYLKKVLYHGHVMDDKKLKHEIGDVMHYIAGLCTMFGFSMEECATLNIVKLQERYPEGFSKIASVERKDKDE